MFRYWFGVYHWRRRLRRIGVGLAVALGGVALGTVVATGAAYVAGLVLVFAGLRYGQPALKRLLVPAPWEPDRWQYAPLGHALDLGDADRWLDVGCGTGRSLVGLSGASRAASPNGDGVGHATTADGRGAPRGTRVTALDAFDARVILGNGARLAERNAAAAGLDAEAVRGDAARLPVAGGSQDVVTACRVLHDLPRADAEAAVAEARRALREGGRFGVLELRTTHEETEEAVAYWEAMLADGGFDVEVSGEVSRGDSWYCYLVGTPSGPAN
ncbi:class I SAM-dependent methyltransferase [Halorarum salinum]|uniref:Methyltransferase domain-containing protein n=1 Tax=Halorarum salinum TaxID=2743089 RepID=A0A7D5LAD5_9EURY|nr:methyltransferase domain-containing protein [Halobaculum salinum]QLG61814.1 methyltransferase domain-containing protein [Halobaculum salinum]